MLAPSDEGQDPWTQQDVNLNTLQQREQRQRSIRFLMMFLLMLTLMDGEEAQRKRGQDSFNLRKRKSNRDFPMDRSLYSARRNQDAKLEQLLQGHPRYQHLVTRNNGKDFDKEVRVWAEQQPELQKDEFTQGLDRVQGAEPTADPMKETKVFHYPWNATGFYRGEWSRNASQSTIQHMKNNSMDEQKQRRTVEALEIEAQMAQLLQARGESAGVFLLPDEIQLKLPNASTITDELPDKKPMSHQPTFLRGATMASDEDPAKNLQVTLTKTSGRAAFQLYSRPVPVINELSIIDGFVKLYDSNTVGYSTRRDILLRVNGVALHSLGILSLVASPSQARSAFVILSQEQKNERRRRLKEAISKPALQIDQIRDDALSLYPPGEITHEGPRDPNYNAAIASISADESTNTGMQMNQNLGLTGTSEPPVLQGNITTRLQSSAEIPSEIVFPYPFVMDDKGQSIGRTRTPAARSMPPREQLLEANAGNCEFEITLNIQEEEWTVGQWRTLLARYANEAAKLDSATRESLNQDEATKGTKEGTEKNSKKAKGSKKRRVPQDQALVMTLNGTIVSRNCEFRAELNATAVRTDWEHTTGKAINYSFYMMLTCLTQIVLLLRQLLHSQAQSAATRVSLLCIGWQTVLDALLCLVHIYLSLAMQPLFTAFASVAFFKLLIFCVIEMKYMAIIIQARNANNGGNTVDLLRRQIAMLHLRFYVALLGTFIAFFYAWESYRTVYMLMLYSFWVPQIVHNIVTEAKHPLHHYYIYGMSITRLVAPLYIFAVQNNFLKEVYPDSPTNVFMCELLVLWVGIQAAVLQAQGKYGTRFMIPARFLPPKFDYSRPIPPSLLPPEAEEETPSESLHKERAAPEMRASLIARESGPRKATGARNRMKGNRTNKNETPMTTETISASPARPPPSFECCICYNEIDIRNRSGYMLAPCDHLFHRDCLVQWMEVKMECPICRKDLPAL
jgi:hypothetical protein